LSPASRSFFCRLRACEPGCASVRWLANSSPPAVSDGRWLDFHAR
jgi:hypothetical protein